MMEEGRKGAMKGLTKERRPFILRSPYTVADLRMMIGTRHSSVGTSVIRGGPRARTAN